jgi:hypothetical protein
MGHGFHGYVSHNQRVLTWRSVKHSQTDRKGGFTQKLIQISQVGPPTERHYPWPPKPGELEAGSFHGRRW